MKATDLFVRCLESEGVEYIFGIPGEENIDLMDSLSRSSIVFVVTRHEQGAAFMADAYGRVTGKPGVCLSTLGPGATNLITGVANAHLDRVPLVAITGQAELTRLHKESHQNVDTLQQFEGITKYNRCVVDAVTIPEMVRQAFRLTTSGSPGAVHIQLPEDVAKEDVTGLRPLPAGEQAKVQPNDQALMEAARLIEEASRPVILAGNGVIRSRAWEGLRSLVDSSLLPLTNTFMAKGLLPFDHPHNLFTVGGNPYPSGLRPLQEADLVIAVGFDLVEYDPETWNEDGSRRVLYLHSIPAQTDEHFPVQLELVGDMTEMLRVLAGMVQPRKGPSAHGPIRARRLEELQRMPETDEALPRQVMYHLSERLPRETVVISDVGLHKVWVSRWYQPQQPARTIIYNGLASMGGSLPGAIGVKLAHPTDPVVVVSGDGGFLMNAQELETAKRLNLDFTVIVFHDGKYSLIAKKQRDAGLAVTQISFTNPDFELFAHSFGMDHRRVETAEDFATALDDALASKRLNMIEVAL